MPDVMMESVAAQFRALGEISRLRLLERLIEGPRNVTELAEYAELSHANASKHLNVLASAGLVARRKEGSTVLYEVVDSTPERLCRTMCDRITSRLEDDLATAKRFRGR
jgi:DNA-binding transcriptional ArsR family regulator